jgi:hypothetical protein
VKSEDLPGGTLKDVVLYITGLCIEELCMKILLVSVVYECRRER